MINLSKENLRNTNVSERVIENGTTFVCVGNNRLEAYGAHMDFEMGFDNPDLRTLMTFDEFCKELDLGYGKANYIQIARLYEDADGKIWYDNEYCQ